MFWVRWFYSLFERMRLKRKKTMFILTNQPLITSFYINKAPIFCRISDASALIRNFLCKRRVRGVNRSGVWGLNYLWAGRAFNKVDGVAWLIWDPSLGRPVFLALDRRKTELSVFWSEEYLKAVEAVQVTETRHVVVDRMDVPLVSHHRCLEYFYLKILIKN